MKEFYFNNKDGKLIEVGLDEAGRGPLIGRVYAAVVNWGDTKIDDKIKIIDSKKLSSKKRQESLEWIQKNVDEWAVAWAEPKEIDEINILEATRLAMQRAIDLLEIKPTHLIIDGVGWEKKFSGYKVTSVVKGDSKFYSIAAASILAKEYHDEHILELCKNDPLLVDKYCLDSNMGYASQKHIDGIKKYGYTNYHRKSFKLKCL
jgi:ribonuclease HII